MPFDEDELLAAGLGALGGAGTRNVARRMRKNAMELEVVVDLQPPAAADLVQRVLAEHGQFLGAEDDQAGGAVRCTGMVGSGGGNLNPAVITITIRPDGNGSALSIRGAAKEGLIKQRGGEKAARRIAAALGQAAEPGAVQTD